MQTAVRLLGGTNSSRVEEEMERVLDLEKELASVRGGWERLQGGEGRRGGWRGKGRVREVRG